MAKAKIIIVSGFIRLNYDDNINKVNDIIDIVNARYNKAKLTYEDMTYVELYPTGYQDKDVIGIDIKIIKPTNKLVLETYKNLKKDLFKIFGKRLTILVRADKEKIF